MNLLSSLRGKCLLFSKANYSPLRYPCRNFIKRPSREDGGMNLAPKIKKSQDTQEHRVLPTFLKCFTFTSGFCGTVFIGSSIWNYENVKKTFQNQELSEWIKSRWNKLDGFEHKGGDFRKFMNKYWNELADGGKIFWGICAANVFVFLCWRYPPLQSTMMKYFCSSPVARAVCWPMFLSTFSHYAPLHLIMNMYVLNSFSAITSSTLGPEQFLAFYLAGGVVSSFMSNTFKLLTRTVGPSLGASGAIMAMLGYFCTKYPDAKLGIVFIPNMPFSADTALKAVMLLDLSGIIFRWKLFDHAAHLGGALFGIFYALIGQSVIWGNRSYVNKVWEDFSSKYTDKKK